MDGNIKVAEDDMKERSAKSGFVIGAWRANLNRKLTQRKTSPGKNKN